MRVLRKEVVEREELSKATNLRVTNTIRIHCRQCHIRLTGSHQKDDQVNDTQR